VFVAAQAQIEEEHEVGGTLNKDQHYYFKIIVTKKENGVRVTVSCWSSPIRSRSKLYCDIFLRYYQLMTVEEKRKILILSEQTEREV